MTRHREQLRERLANINLDNKFCIDWGSGAKPAAKYINQTNCRWLCLDKNPDMVETYKTWGLEYKLVDLEKFQFLNDYPQADVAFCLEVLEHVKNPEQLLHSIANNLKPGGLFYITLPFMYPIHSDEDYWRWTEQGAKELINERAELKVTKIEPFENETGYWIEVTK